MTPENFEFVTANQNKIMAAIDNKDWPELERFMQTTGKHLTLFKLGLEFFNRYGKEGVARFLTTYPDKKVFLDLKLHDIPNTVAKAILALEGLNLSFLTIHLTGGRQMIREARRAMQTALPECQLLGVSFLTSLGEADFDELFGLEFDNHELKHLAFSRLLRLAHEEKVDGVVCSPSELDLLAQLRRDHGHSYYPVTPGIRFAEEIASGITHDQKRVMSPQDALALGARYLVMGRSL